MRTMRIPFATLRLFLALQPAAQEGAWDYFGPAASLKSLAARGNTILVGTEGAGLVRFDTLAGRSFISTGNSGIPSDTVLQLAIDTEENWWIHHPGGISRFDGAGWQSWRLAETGLPAAAAIRAMKTAPGGSLYVATDNGAAIFQDGAWSALNMANSGLPDNTIRDLAISPEDGALWACTVGGLARYDGQSWSRLTSGNSGLPSNDTWRITFDHAGGMYVGYAGATLAVFRDGAWAELIPPAGEGFTNDIPWGFKVDSRNRLWFAFDIGAVGSGKFGVYRYDPMLVGAEETASAQAALTVYPNPTAGTLAVQLETAQSGNVQLRLCNMQGQTVYSSVVPQADGQPIQVDLGRLPACVYWLSAIQGGRLYTARVLKL